MNLTQGPALYAYNDAVFTEHDWTGIRMLQDSIKETDGMKIGRFGLGFKSVFHMTGMTKFTISYVFVTEPLKIAIGLKFTFFMALFHKKMKANRSVGLIVEFLFSAVYIHHQCEWTR